MTVIVGIDGSGHATNALRWAVEEARMRDEELWAVYVYTSPSLYYPPDVFPTASAERLSAETRKTAQQELDQALAEATSNPEGEAAEGVAVVKKIIEDPQPAYALTDLAGPGDLLVVGSRGRGGFKGLVLGSVSQQVAQHAPCPVTIVRGPGAPSH